MSIQSENENLIKIKTFLEKFEKSHKKTTFFHISIKVNDKIEYKTTFHVVKIPKHSKLWGEFNLNNGCIEIRMGKEPPPDQTTSSIRADKEGLCFRPRLVSNIRNKNNPNRIIATDVLQILKTKLSFTNPLYEAEYIELMDSAIIDGVWMTPFRLLRGEQPFYHKYGYNNPQIPILKTIINKLKGNDLKLIPNNYITESLYDTINHFYIKEGKEIINDNRPLVDIMNTISFDEEKEYNVFNIKDGAIKLSVVILYSIINFYSDIIDKDTISYYKLDTDSTEWKSSSRKVIITNVEFEDLDKINTIRKTNKTRKASKKCNSRLCTIMG